MKIGTRRKREHEKAVRLNLTLPPGIYNEGAKIILAASYSGWSEYLAAKVRRDGKLDPEDQVAA